MSISGADKRRYEATRALPAHCVGTNQPTHGSSRQRHMNPHTHSPQRRSPKRVCALQVLLVCMVYGMRSHTRVMLQWDVIVYQCDRRRRAAAASSSTTSSGWSLGSAAWWLGGTAQRWSGAVSYTEVNSCALWEYFKAGGAWPVFVFCV